MWILYFILIYFILSTAFASTLFYVKHKDSVEMRGLNWSAYLIAGSIYGWITTPMYIFVCLIEYIGGWLGKSIDKTLSKLLKKK